MRLQAVSFIKLNEQQLEAGAIFDATEEQAKGLLDNGAAVVYAESVDTDRLGGSSGITETVEGAATEAPPPATTRKGKK